MTVEMEPENIAPPMEDPESIASSKNVDYQQLLSTLSAFKENGITSSEKLLEIGKRIANLTYYRMSQGMARKVAADELTDMEYSELGEILGVSDDEIIAASEKAFSSRNPSLMNFHRLAGPTNVLFDMDISVPRTGGGETQHVLVEVLDRDEESREQYIIRGDPPMPGVREFAEDPRYGLVKLPKCPYAKPEKEKKIDEPSERSHGLCFGDLTVSWFYTEEELVDYLYSDRIFPERDYAKTWEDLLTMLGFDVPEAPSQQAN